MLRRLFQLSILAAAGYLLLTVFPDVDEIRQAALSESGSAERSTRLVREKDDGPPTELEKSAKRDLEAQVRRESRNDQVVKTDGRVLRGRIVSESQTSIRLLQSFGSTGQMETTLPRSEVREVVRNSREAPEISFRDVRFRLEFPDFNFYRHPPFTIVSDQDFFRVADAVSLLEGLDAELTRAFGPLMDGSERGDGIQLLFFSDQRQFDDYRKRYASELSYASGFYSFSKDRLVVFDQKSSSWAQEASGRASMLKSIHGGNALVRGEKGEVVTLDEWHRSTTSSIRAEAKRANRVILRHEGAHQLFFAHGVHSEHGAEHPWLIEGLAGLCEDGIGRRSDDAGQRGRRTTFPELVNFSDQASFGGLDDDRRFDAWLEPNTEVAAAAYAQSRFTVQHLMRKHRDGFYEYIRFVRDPANQHELGSAPRFDLLSRYVGRTPEELEHELEREHSQL